MRWAPQNLVLHLFPSFPELLLALYIVCPSCPSNPHNDRFLWKQLLPPPGWLTDGQRSAGVRRQSRLWAPPLAITSFHPPGRLAGSAALAALLATCGRPPHNDPMLLFDKPAMNASVDAKTSSLPMLHTTAGQC